MYKRKLLTAIFFSILTIGCHNSSSTKTTPKPIGELIDEINATELKSKLLSEGWPIEGYSLYGYKAYKISYTTHDEKDREVDSSGLLVVPTELTPLLKEDGLSIVNSLHGTITLNENSPTEYTKKYKQLNEEAIVFSSLGGFITLQPDYVGYGDSSSHYHPFTLKKSLANSAVDLLEATEKFAKENGIKLDKRLFVTGYSEGGYATMPTVQKLEKMGRTVVASAPLDGDYDLNYLATSSIGMQEDENLTGFSSAYFALIALAYTEVYDKNISTVINKPYDSIIKNLLDGKHSYEQIEKALPKNIYGENGLFRSDFLGDYITNSKNWLREALKENSINAWSPKSPIHIVHCQGDDIAPYSVAQKLYETMIDNGVENLEFITPDENEPIDKKWSHEECVYPALEDTLFWFLKMRYNY